MELSIANTTSFDTTYLTSASYIHTGFWTGAVPFLVEGESLELEGGNSDIAVIKFKMEEGGESPDEGSMVGSIVLGATETGIYPVASTSVAWNPVRIERITGMLAKSPLGISTQEAASAPTLPYPLSWNVTTFPGSTDYQVTIAAVNPFTLTVWATVTQTVPAGFTILDAGGGGVVDNNVVWTEEMEQGEGVELRALLGWAGEPGETASIPGPELSFRDPSTLKGDTYTTIDKTVPAAWPLDIIASVPPEWRSGVAVTVPITLTNISTAITAQGIFTATVSTPEDQLLWTITLPVNAPPGGTQDFSLPILIETDSAYAVLSGEVALNGVRRHVLEELIAVHRKYEIYLPLVLKSH